MSEIRRKGYKRHRAMEGFFEYAVLQTAAGKTEHVGALFENFCIGEHIIDSRTVYIRTILLRWFFLWLPDLCLIIRF